MSLQRRLTQLGPLLMATGLLTSCHATPGISNGSVSACFRAIPAAEAAIHEKKASLISVHRVAEDNIRAHLPASAQAELANENDTEVCAVTFKGTFAAGQVDMAPATQTGSYAIVLVSSRHLHQVAAVVLDHLPSGLGKRTI